MNRCQLEKLGIPLPPSDAFGVELTPGERDTITLWALSQIAASRSVRNVDTVSKTVTSAASIIVPAAASPRPVVLQNNSDTLNVWIAINQTPTATFGIKIPPNGYWESPFDFVEAVQAVSTGSATITLVNSRR